MKTRRNNDHGATAVIMIAVAAGWGWMVGLIFCVR